MQNNSYRIQCKRYGLIHFIRNWHASLNKTRFDKAIEMLNDSSLSLFLPLLSLKQIDSKKCVLSFLISILLSFVTGLTRAFLFQFVCIQIVYNCVVWMARIEIEFKRKKEHQTTQHL